MQTEALGNLQPTITPTPTYENSRLTGLAIRKLMRKHGKTIRSLAGEYQLTLKRVREAEGTLDVVASAPRVLKVFALTGTTAAKSCSAET